MTKIDDNPIALQPLSGDGRFAASSISLLRSMTPRQLQRRGTQLQRQYQLVLLGIRQSAALQGLLPSSKQRDRVRLCLERQIASPACRIHGDRLGGVIAALQTGARWDLLIPLRHPAAPAEWLLQALRLNAIQAVLRKRPWLVEQGLYLDVPNLNNPAAQYHFLHGLELHSNVILAAMLYHLWADAVMGLDKLVYLLRERHGLHSMTNAAILNLPDIMLSTAYPELSADELPQLCAARDMLLLAEKLCDQADRVPHLGHLLAQYGSCYHSARQRHSDVRNAQRQALRIALADQAAHLDNAGRLRRLADLLGLAAIPPGAVTAPFWQTA